MRRQKLEQYREYFDQNGHTLVDSENDAEKVLVWTCSFRADVRDNSLAEIKRLRDNGADVVVGGCLPDIDNKILAEHHDGDVLNWKDDVEKMADIFGSEKVKLSDLVVTYGEDQVCEDLEVYKKEHPNEDVQFYDRFNKLVISEGCPLRCTYCSEKLMFPPFYSFPVNDVVAKCKAMVENTGEYRVSLLADSLGDYGSDLESDFPSLLHSLRGIDDRISFLLGNLNPYHIIKFYDEFDDMLGKGYFHHISLPMQSGSDKVLELMERPYTAADLTRIYELLDRHGFDNYDTHILIGFPGEQEEDFLLTCELILDRKPNHVLLSGCMLNENIPAAKLAGRVDDAVIASRISRAEKLFSEVGIFCNAEGGIHMTSRMKERMN